MNKHVGGMAFVVGLAAVVWVGAGYAGSHPLALAMTALIGAFYLAGALELRRFRQATAALDEALVAVPENLPALDDWLARVPAALQNPVRQRIQGERVGLPGPVMTPYLVGLLVLLGMLGTFLGMVVTLDGAVMALESTTDLPTIRAALSAPVKGLGLAFGTSVAGVAASAMLGLMSALCRRERLHAAQRLDTRIATTLRAFTLAHRREESFKTLQHQARVIPELVGELQTSLQSTLQSMAQAMVQGMSAQLERQGQALNDRLLASQDAFFRHTQAVYSDLAASVEKSLKDSLAESARATGAAIQPMAQATLSGIARESSLVQERMADAVQRQLDGLSARFDTTVTTVSDGWRDALARQQADLAAADQQRQAALAQSLQSMAAALQQEWARAGESTRGHQQQICQTLERTAGDIHAQAQAHARATIAEIARLTQLASEAPRAAAEVMGQLRQQLSDSMVRDNELLEERQRIMETLRALLEAIRHAATEQRGAIDALVASSAAQLQQVGTQFGSRIESESARLADVATQVTASAVEVASLGEAFGFGVQQFSTSSQALITTLARIEGALDKSAARSDEQLAYCVAQAREVIDLSMLSQKQIVEELQQLASRQAALAGEAG